MVSVLEKVPVDQETKSVLLGGAKLASESGD
jgi:hypothetical protein